MDKHKIIFTVAMFFTCMLFGFPFIYSINYQPASIVSTEQPEYHEIKKNTFLVMSYRINLEKGKLFRYQNRIGEDQISRVVGMPGDLVKFKSNALYINNQLYSKYKKIILPNSELLVPNNTVFRFPDYILGDFIHPYQSLESFITYKVVINGTVLKVFNQNTIVTDHPMDFMFGLVLVLLFFFVFYLLFRHKDLIYNPILYFCRLLIGANLLCISVGIVAATLLSQWAFIPTLYYIFIYWLIFVWLSILESNIFFIIIFGLVSSITYINLTAKQSKNRYT